MSNHHTATVRKIIPRLIDITDIGPLKLKTILDHSDYSRNLLFNGQFNLKMTVEQFQDFTEQLQKYIK